MPHRDWRIRIADILRAIEKISSNTKEFDAKRFSSNDWAQDAVLRNLAVIGEAANGVPLSVRTEYPEIPWDDMRDIQNIIVHEYFGIDVSIIWTTIQEDLPPLTALLKKMLESGL